MMGNTFDYTALHGRGIAQLRNHSFCSCSEEALNAKVIVPKEYAMIDVIYGVQKQFKPETDRLLRNYTQQGGRLLISGANLGTANTQDFNSSIFQSFSSSVLTDKSITGVNGSNLDFTIYREMNPYSYAVPRITSISPLPQSEESKGTSFAMLQYSNNQPAGIAYDGSDYKAVVIGFPIESIREADSRNALMRAVTNFLCK